jgi:uncharacterized membrane protein
MSWKSVYFLITLILIILIIIAIPPILFMILASFISINYRVITVLVYMFTVGLPVIIKLTQNEKLHNKIFGD